MLCLILKLNRIIVTCLCMCQIHIMCTHKLCTFNVYTKEFFMLFQGADDEYEIQTYVIAFLHVSGSHTAEMIKKRYDSILKFYKIGIC